MNRSCCLPDGGRLLLLRDAANYITALPKTDSALPEWQAAIEALMLVKKPAPGNVVNLKDALHQSLANSGNTTPTARLSKTPAKKVAKKRKAG